MILDQNSKRLNPKLPESTHPAIGIWIPDKAYYTLQGLSHITFKCSKCKKVYAPTKFCPNCGTKMKEVNYEMLRQL